MARLIPVAEYLTMYHVDTDAGTELVPADVCGKIDLDLALDDVTLANARLLTALHPYVEGREIYAVSEQIGWYSRLSAPGYLDCTSWDGPYPTDEEAFDAVQDEYEVDAYGNEIDDEGEPL